MKKYDKAKRNHKTQYHFDINPGRDGKEEMKFIDANKDDLRETYGGNWIAVLGDEMIAYAPTLTELITHLSDKEMQKVYVEFLPE